MIKRNQCGSPLELAISVFSEFNDSGLTYVHWKSNAFLSRALAGDEDLDLYVDRSDSSKCQEILFRFSFKRAISISEGVHLSTEHYYGNDPATGKLVHFHIYYQFITGDSLVKNFGIPFHKLLLSNVRSCGIVSIPSAESELIALGIRCALKQGKFVERKLFDRDRERIVCERDWLSGDVATDKLAGILARFFPMLSLALLEKSLKSISQPEGTLSRYRLCKRMERAFDSQRRFVHITHFILHAWLTIKLLTNRVINSKGGMTFASGGMVIAFVGPQATGKSSLTESIKQWIGKEFRVVAVHTGKPPSALLTLLPNMLMPLARRLFPTRRSSQIETSADDVASYSLIHLFRIVCLAHDRKALIRKIRRRSSNGSIVICDRYPSLVSGAIDSRHFSDMEILGQTSKLKRWLMQLETDIYKSIQPPDLVIELTVPVDVAVERDRVRVKAGKKDEEYVRRRHAMATKPQFDAPTVRISTLNDLSVTERLIKDVIWKAI